MSVKSNTAHANKFYFLSSYRASSSTVSGSGFRLCRSNEQIQSDIQNGHPTVLWSIFYETDHDKLTTGNVTFRATNWMIVTVNGLTTQKSTPQITFGKNCRLGYIPMCNLE